MPNASSITLYDNSATPVAMVFDPLFKDGDVFVFENADAQSSLGRATLRLRLKRAAKGGAVDRVQYWLTKPIETTVDGQVVVLETERVNGEFFLPVGRTSNDRAALLAQVASLPEAAMMVSYVQDLKPAY